ncbi:hypothetical protein [[Mycoplasma] collis]|uniref:hypothetical protein n=1 Tax=[Mycoplasma] collis TaxID=2127 RepID=UPI00051AB300|nr:hypothetical protein [[Mycoplasma] collis]
MKKTKAIKYILSLFILFFTLLITSCDKATMNKSDEIVVDYNNDETIDRDYEIDQKLKDKINFSEKEDHYIDIKEQYKTSFNLSNVKIKILEANFDEFVKKYEKIKSNYTGNSISLVFEKMIDKKEIEIKNYFDLKNKINNNRVFCLFIKLHYLENKKVFFIKLSIGRKHNDHFHFSDYKQFTIYFKN